MIPVRGKIVKKIADKTNKLHSETIFVLEARGFDIHLTPANTKSHNDLVIYADTGKEVYAIGDIISQGNSRYLLVDHVLIIGTRKKKWKRKKKWRK